MPPITTVKRWIKDHLPDTIYVRRQYRFHTGQRLDLENPKGLSEKICWLKLYGMTPLHSLCADKITAPAYVAARLGPGHTVPRLFATYDVQDIAPEHIEWSTAMIKTNHDQGGIFPVYNKADVDWKALRRELTGRLSQPFHLKARERQYRDIRPGLVVEELLQATDDPYATDFRFYCFNGIPRFMRITQLDASVRPSHKIAGGSFDLEGRPLVYGLTTDGGELAPPEDLADLAEQARILAEPFALVRVDFLRMGDRTYVGELTMTPNAGVMRFSPPEWDTVLGADLDHRAPCKDWERHLEDASRHLEVCRIRKDSAETGTMPGRAPSLPEGLTP